VRGKAWRQPMGLAAGEQLAEMSAHEIFLEGG
jgi:hypothetical protein